MINFYRSVIRRRSNVCGGRIDRRRGIQRLEARRFFGFDFPEPAIRAALHNTQKRGLAGPHRVRLVLEKDGNIDVQVQALVDLPRPLFSVIAPERIDASDPLLRHKTTARLLFDNALHRLKGNPSCFDPLFFNEREELTEGARSNVFLKKKLKQ